MAENVFLSLGSNLGDRLSYLNQAVEELDVCGIKCVKKSPVYETDSWGYDDEPYLNQVLECETFLTPEKLLEETSKIETLLGRKRTLSGYQARTIDIDILFYDNEIIDIPRLIIPHPKIALRLFVLIPLCDIAPEFLHPVLKKTVRQLLDECEDTGRVEKILL
ncbi:MAG: 2-amino-4-hydroxy-6-hydroxymethyldihydropteridine diphosphokinase [Bacteroidales bacterium]|nr:2-amino-4-hydroxy-6-hydroxymethyldihydropteridine diphosphokinase [Bacteroidales bacterium]